MPLLRDQEALLRDQWLPRSAPSRPQARRAMEATVADENGAEARAPEQMDLDCGPFTVAVDDWVQHARAQLAAGEDAQLKLQLTFKPRLRYTPPLLSA